LLKCILYFALGGVFTGLFYAPDPQALKVQGPDNSGNPLPVFTATPGTTGATVTWKGNNTTNAGNASLSATMSAEVGRTNFCSQITFSTSGATAGSVIDVSLTNVIGGTMHFAYNVPTGATTAGAIVVIPFNPPIPATGTNTIINLTVPANGAGGVQQTATIQGFSQ